MSFFYYYIIFYYFIHNVPVILTKKKMILIQKDKRQIYRKNPRAFILSFYQFHRFHGQAHYVDGTNNKLKDPIIIIVTMYLGNLYEINEQKGFSSEKCLV